MCSCEINRQKSFLSIYILFLAKIGAGRDGPEGNGIPGLCCMGLLKMGLHVYMFIGREKPSGRVNTEMPHVVIPTQWD